mmetsp:Transcript_14715/g.22296  ORF Transcript_14715/g.22296 Transcript_14715/m.22296 type:complete len:209 (+) Transcript_14715:32-658(+)
MLMMMMNNRQGTKRPRFAKQQMEYINPNKRRMRRRCSKVGKMFFQDEPHTLLTEDDSAAAACSTYDALCALPYDTSLSIPMIPTSHSNHALMQLYKKHSICDMQERCNSACPSSSVSQQLLPRTTSITTQTHHYDEDEEEITTRSYDYGSSRKYIANNLIPPCIPEHQIWPIIPSVESLLGPCESMKIFTTTNRDDVAMTQKKKKQKL